MAPSILLVGCGKIGNAYLKGLQSSPLASITVIEPNRSQLTESAFPSVTFLSGLEELPKSNGIDLVIIAVKPHLVKQIIKEVSIHNPKVLISLAAGIRQSDLKSWSGLKAMIIRAMPNLPASIGKGMTVALEPPHLDAKTKSVIMSTLSLTGEVRWIQDETLMDVVTALSGSGPAYLFALVEAMAKGGVLSGLDEKLAYELARSTVIGSAYLLEASKEKADVLRHQVTSPAGTTEAALSVLLAKEGGLDELLTRAIAEATKRSQELASDYHVKN